MATNTVQTIKLENYRPSDFSVREHELTFILNSDHSLVKHIQHLESNSPNTPLILNGEDLEIVSIAIDGNILKPEDYTYQNNILTIEKVPEKFTLETTVKHFPDNNKELSGLYRSNGIFCTQCEAEGFRRISFSIDRPDLLATYRVRIEADKESCPVLLSNGNLMGEGELENGRHYAEWHDPHPKPCYLFALVAGDLGEKRREITTPHGHKIDLRIYTEHPFIEQTEHAMQSLIEAITWDEKRFNLDYDLGRFNIVAVSDFNMGAMENKSLNIFNTKYILGDIETATDADFHGIQAVVGHEYFHNWTGNRITCRDWFQLSLKEGLTVFRDQEFSGDHNEASLERIENVKILRRVQFAEDASPLSHPVQPQEYAAIDNFYTATVYEKGAEVIRMYHTILGEEIFQKGMKLYIERHDGQAVRIEEFAQCMEDASGFPFSGQFFKWYTTKGTPHVTFSSDYDAEKRTLTLTALQDTTKVDPQIPLLIPVRFSLLNKDGESFAFEDGINERLWLLREKEESLVIPNVEPDTIPVWMHGFTAPIYYDYSYTDHQLAHIVRHSRDAFTRFEAMEILYRRLFDDACSGSATFDDKSTHFVTLLNDVLAHKELSRGEKANLLTLPATATIINTLPSPLDMDTILEADKRIASVVANGLQDAALAYLNDTDAEELPLHYTVDAAQSRRLRAILMHHLAVTEKQEYREIFAKAYKEAQNMTTRIAALVALNATDDSYRNDAMQAFAQAYAEYPLVIDKWFALQGSASYDNALPKMQELTQDSRFVVTNPNRFRAFIGPFAHNLRMFHAKDGSGYEFVASQIERIMKLNVQLAARVLNVFGVAPRLDSQRQDQIAKLLTSLRDGAGIDAAEVIDRILNSLKKDA